MRATIGHAWLYLLIVVETIATPLRDHDQSVLINGQYDPSADGPPQGDCSASIDADVAGKNIHAIARVNCIKAAGSLEETTSPEAVVEEVGRSIDIQVLRSGETVIFC